MMNYKEYLVSTGETAGFCDSPPSATGDGVDGQKDKSRHMTDYLWVIASLLFLIALGFLWLLLPVYLQAKALTRVEENTNRIGRRLVELGCVSDEPNSIVYKDLVQKVNLQELWARIRTRIRIKRKNPADVELVVRLVRLISEIESVIQNDFTSRTLAQIGDWDDEKIAFFREAGVKQRASIAAIDQLVADIEHELRGPPR
jgi:signal transduction histidine kinase